MTVWDFGWRPSRRVATRDRAGVEPRRGRTDVGWRRRTTRASPRAWRPHTAARDAPSRVEERRAARSPRPPRRRSARSPPGTPCARAPTRCATSREIASGQECLSPRGARDRRATPPAGTARTSAAKRAARPPTRSIGTRKSVVDSTTPAAAIIGPKARSRDRRDRDDGLFRPS